MRSGHGIRAKVADHIGDMLLKHEEPGRAIVAALDALLGNDAHLFEVDANERSITHRLAMYLQAELLPIDPALSVDCEYNRTGLDPKRIGHSGLHPGDADTDAQTSMLRPLSRVASSHSCTTGGVHRPVRFIVVPITPRALPQIGGPAPESQEFLTGPMGME